MSKDTGGPATAHEAFARALEEAAKVCEELIGIWHPVSNVRGVDSAINNTLRTVSASIRAIKNPYPAPTPPEEKP